MRNVQVLYERVLQLTELKAVQTVNWILLVGGVLLCIAKATRPVGTVMVLVFVMGLAVVVLLGLASGKSNLFGKQ